MLSWTGLSKVINLNLNKDRLIKSKSNRVDILHDVARVLPIMTADANTTEASLWGDVWAC